jgi:hypothetical protein
MDNELNKIYKFQLLEALLKGNIHQQVFAIKALSELYSSDISVIQPILDKLNAPHSKVRMALLSSLNNLNIDNVKSKDILTYLEHHRKPFSDLSLIQKFITQILIGRGEIGLEDNELALLNKYFEGRNQNNDTKTNKRSEFYELNDKINDFLYKKDLKKKIRDYTYLDNLGESLDETNLLELLNESDIYLNEAVFDIFLEKKLLHNSNKQ